MWKFYEIQISMFIHKVLLEHSHAALRTYFPQLLSCYLGKISSLQRICVYSTEFVVRLKPRLLGDEDKQQLVFPGSSFT